MNTFLSAYLQKIGYKGSAKADIQTLNDIVYLHTLRIPFENLTPYTFNQVSLGPDALAQKLVTEERGGFCFEQNSLLSRVLREIGFSVTEIGGRVVYNQPDDTIITHRSHMILKVDLEGQAYLTDVGFGGLTLTSPIKLELDIEQPTHHELFRIKTIGNDLKLQGLVNGEWKTTYRFNLEEQYPADYKIVCYFLCTHPTSHFTNNLILAKPTQDGRMALNNTKFSFYHLDGSIEKRELTSVEEIKEVITQKFGVEIPNFPNLDERLRQLTLI